MGLREVSTVCHDSDKFRYQIDTVIRQLMKRGAWFGTEVYAKFCVYGSHITFPRYVGTVIGAATCQGQSRITNNWYSIVGPRSCCSLFNPSVNLVDDGMSPVYNEVTGAEGKQIAYHVEKSGDVGKKVKIYGFSYGNEPLREKNSDGVWEDGVTVTAGYAGGNTPPQMTTQLVTKITHIVRQPTQGRAWLYEYGPDANNDIALNYLAMYEPNETNPMYRRMKVQNYAGIPGVEDDYGRIRKQIDVMVKLEHIKLVNDYDFLLIDDFDALRYGIQALRADEAGNAGDAEVFWNKAVRELNFLDRVKTPPEQIAVKVRTGGFVASLR